MWQDILIGVLVGLAAIYLIRRLRRVTSGQTACEEGVCEGCSALSTCQDALVDRRPQAGEEGGPPPA